jgi:MFS family permease
MANAFTIVGDLFSPRERGKWQGLISAVFGLSSVIGPLLGGFLTDPHTILTLTTNWRWTFWINVPIGIVSFLVIARYTPTIKHEHKPKIDYLGASFLAVTLSSIILAVDNTEKVFSGLISGNITVDVIKTALFIIAALAAAVFVLVERRAEEPIIPLRFFKNETFTTIMIAMLLFGAAFLGAILYLTQFNQQVFGANATTAGLMLLPMIVGMSGTAALTGQFVSRTGKYKIPLMTGFAFGTIGILSLLTLTPTTPYWHEAIIMAFVGIGLGMGMPIMNLAVQNEFEQRDLGAATASTQLFRGLGSTIGTAVLGSILTAGVASHLSSVNSDPYIQTLKQQPAAAQILGSNVTTDTALTLNTTDVKNRINQGLDKGLAASSVPEAAKTKIKDNFASQQNAFSDRVVNAFSTSLHQVFITSGILMALGAVAASFVQEKPLRGGHDDTPGVE